MRAGINVFASRGIFDVLEIDAGRRVKYIKDRTIVTFGTDFKVRAFYLNHDAVEPLGFIVWNKDEYLLFAPDTSHITQRFNVPFSIIAIECSYDKNILQKQVDAGDINEEVAKRLLTSHMEKQTAMRYLAKYCNLSKCREIHLLHMSGNNISKEQTRVEFEKKFFIETRIV